MVASKNLGLTPELLFANHFTDDFSLTLLTTNPESGVKKIETLFKRADLNFNDMKYTEYNLSGQHVGDMVLIRNNQLVNFRSAQDTFSEQLAEISRELDLPRTVDNPTLVKIFTDKTVQTPERADIFRNNTLIQQLPLDSDRTNVLLQGSIGSLAVSVKNKQVQITTASCKHQTCLKMGSIHQAGQNLVCIPNQIRIAIAGNNAFGVDSVSF